MVFKFPQQDAFNKYLAKYSSLPYYKRILHGMIKYGDMYQEVASLPYLGKAMAKEENAVKRAEIYMLRKDLINTQDDIQGRRIIVTSRGHKIFYKEYPLAKLRKRKWDGKWTLVMYDFPEKFKNIRDEFREKLKDLGFGIIQKSILISPLPYDEDIQSFIEGEGHKRIKDNKNYFRDGKSIF